MAIKVGVYDGKAILSSVQYGLSSKQESPQIGLDFKIKVSEGQYQDGTVFLSFAPNAVPYSIAKLQACGWKGTSVADLGNLTGIDREVVQIEAKEDVYDGKTRIQLDIRTGPGTVTMTKTMSKEDFVARVKALTSNATAPQGGGSSGAAGAKPPF
jgi:hypothetical protein